MKCLTKTPSAPSVSWAASASVYIGFLIIALAVKEGASGKPH